MRLGILHHSKKIHVLRFGDTISGVRFENDLRRPENVAQWSARRIRWGSSGAEEARRRGELSGRLLSCCNRGTFLSIVTHRILCILDCISVTRVHQKLAKVKIVHFYSLSLTVWGCGQISSLGWNESLEFSNLVCELRNLYYGPQCSLFLLHLKRERRTSQLSKLVSIDIDFFAEWLETRYFTTGRRRKRH